eukprot:13923526-Alexandrium_andersonii.AAC.1
MQLWRGCARQKAQPPRQPRAAGAAAGATGCDDAGAAMVLLLVRLLVQLLMQRWRCAAVMQRWCGR